MICVAFLWLNSPIPPRPHLIACSNYAGVVDNLTRTDSFWTRKEVYAQHSSQTKTASEATVPGYLCSLKRSISRDSHRGRLQLVRSNCRRRRPEFEFKHHRIVIQVVWLKNRFEVCMPGYTGANSGKCTWWKWSEEFTGHFLLISGLVGPESFEIVN